MRAWFATVLAGVACGSTAPAAPPCAGDDCKPCPAVVDTVEAGRLVYRRGLERLARVAYDAADTARAHGHHRLALVTLAIARDASVRAGDDRMTIYAEIMRASVLRRVGAQLEAEQLVAEADAATARAIATATAGDRAWVLLMVGIAQVEAGRHGLAVQPLEDALAAGGGDAIAVSAHLNLAYARRALGDTAAALAHVERAAAAGADRFDLGLARGEILSDAGDLDGALRELAALGDAPDPEWAWQVPYWRGRTEERRGDPAAAERHYRDAIAIVAPLRADDALLAPALVERHRAPYLRLLGLLAAAGRWPDALALVASLDVRAGTSRDGAALATTREGVALDGAALAAAWRGRALVVIVPGGDRMWRIDVRDGAVTGRDLGPAAPLEAAAERLRAEPGDEAAATLLGDALLGADGETGGPLSVLLSGPIARAPLAALRPRDRVIADRPRVRVLGLVPRTAPAARTGGAFVLADPGGDLVAARREGAAVAALLGTRARIWASASTAALAEARGADVLHIAAHAESTADGPLLVLADRAIGAVELAALAPAPRVVVLASCGSAASADVGGQGSIAAAFLAAGSDAVLATVGTVPDAEAAALALAFHRHGGAADPARALAAAQRERAAAGAPAAAWAAFVLIAAPPP